MSEEQRHGPAREGKALLQGLVRCGRCSRRMVVAYGGNAGGAGGRPPQYRCLVAGDQRDGKSCQIIGSRRIDDVVVGALLAVLEPASIEVALEAEQLAVQERESSARMWQLQIEKTEYEAERAERQYHAVEPENRLVARSLERQWEEQLQALGTGGAGNTCAGADCDDSAPNVFAGAPELCDGTDNNCDSIIDEPFDFDGDTYTVCGLGRTDGRPGEYDCDDGDPTIHPGAPELEDGEDSNCDGVDVDLFRSPFAAANFVFNGGFEDCVITAYGTGGECDVVRSGVSALYLAPMAGWRIVGHNYKWYVHSVPLGASPGTEGDQYLVPFQDTAVSYTEVKQLVRTCTDCRDEAAWLRTAPLTLNAEAHLRLLLDVHTQVWGPGRELARGYAELRAVHPSTGAVTPLGRVTFPKVVGWEPLSVTVAGNDIDPSLLGQHVQVYVRSEGAVALGIDNVRLQRATDNLVFNGSFEPPNTKPVPFTIPADKVVAWSVGGLNYHAIGYVGRTDDEYPTQAGTQDVSLFQDPLDCPDGPNCQAFQSLLTQRLRECAGCMSEVEWEAPPPLTVEAGARYQLSARVDVQPWGPGRPPSSGHVAFLVENPSTGRASTVAQAAMPAPLTLAGDPWQTVQLEFAPPAGVVDYEGHHLLVQIHNGANAALEIDDVHLQRLGAHGEPQAATAIDVWLADSTRAVYRDDPPSSTGLALRAARNEFESFQVVVRPVDGVLGNVDVAVHAPPSLGATTIPSTAFTFYRVGYFAAGGYSEKLFQPDMLLPFAPFAGEPGRNQPVWVTFQVPPAAAAGIYVGQLRVSSDELPDRIIDFEIEVLDFALSTDLHGPLATSLSWYPAVEQAGYFENALGDYDPALAEPWYDKLITYGLTPDEYSESYRWPALAEDWFFRRVRYFLRGAKAFVVIKNVESAVAEFFGTPPSGDDPPLVDAATCQADPSCFVNFAICSNDPACFPEMGTDPTDPSWRWDEFRATALFYVGDEVDAGWRPSASTPSIYYGLDGECLYGTPTGGNYWVGEQTWLEFAKSKFAHSDITSNHVRTYSGIRLWDLWHCDFADAPANTPLGWLEVVGTRAVQVPHSILEFHSGFGPTVVDDLLANDVHVWVYHYDGAYNDPVEARALLWPDYYRKVSGYLYYNIAAWGTRPALDPYGSPLVDWDWGAGTTSGVLIYPNGVDPDVPILSTRLENLRDGVEDYEYLWLYGEMCGDPEVARCFAAKIGNGSYAAAEGVSGAELLAVRRQLADNIVSGTCSCP